MVGEEEETANERGGLVDDNAGDDEIAMRWLFAASPLILGFHSSGASLVNSISIFERGY